jgi:hypothetical protein
MRVNGVALALSVPLSLWGALNFGLFGAALGSVTMIQAERIVSLRRISRLTGEPVAALQDWPKLAAVLAASVVSAALAGFAARGWALAPFATLVLGGACMALAYPAALCLAGQRSLITGLIQSLAAPRAAPSGNT